MIKVLIATAMTYLAMKAYKSLVDAADRFDLFDVDMDWDEEC